MIVVDVNIIAYFLIEGERTAKARQLWEVDPQWRVPPLWRHEYLNILATFARHKGADLEDVVMLWQRALDLFGKKEVAIDMADALRVAAETGVSAYDAQYIALAHHLGIFCVTEDQRLIRAFPRIARTIDDSLPS